MAELAYEKLVCDEAEAHGWLCRKLQWIGRRSGPDRFFAKDARVVLMEFKRPGVWVDEGSAQGKELARLRAAGVEVHQVNNHLQALRILGVPYGR